MKGEKILPITFDRVSPKSGMEDLGIIDEDEHSMLSSILANDEGFLLLEKFSRRFFCVENIHFLKEAMEFEAMVSHQGMTDGVFFLFSSIVSRYILPTAELQVNISNRTRIEIESWSTDDKHFSSHPNPSQVFLQAKIEIGDVVKNNLLHHFLRTDEYRIMMHHTSPEKSRVADRHRKQSVLEKSFASLVSTSP
eukprot:CAMPEP_0113938104 /NCGR_PEP_ID=MMETSP1339-20121228/4509_1 /TAXON_ID=94617 /ORGANISM="Fibrocapsa japonica" /LENGTH=193 /DNA_ID=CAMNT_0000941041 /DNA_START=297 /DNA_END=878 /DNA_ORIENTATION=- /assembly_acc=CAM_ASM_000762